MLIPPVPQIAWVIVAFGIALALLVLVVNFIHFIAPLGWVLLVVSALAAIAILVINFEKIIHTVTNIFDRRK